MFSILIWVVTLALWAAPAIAGGCASVPRNLPCWYQPRRRPAPSPPDPTHHEHHRPQGPDHGSTSQPVPEDPPDTPRAESGVTSTAQTPRRLTGPFTGPGTPLVPGSQGSENFEFDFERRYDQEEWRYFRTDSNPTFALRVWFRHDAAANEYIFEVRPQPPPFVQPQPPPGYEHYRMYIEIGIRTSSSPGGFDEQGYFFEMDSYMVPGFLNRNSLRWTLSGDLFNRLMNNWPSFWAPGDVRRSSDTFVTFVLFWNWIDPAHPPRAVRTPAINPFPVTAGNCGDPLLYRHPACVPPRPAPGPPGPPAHHAPEPAPPTPPTPPPPNPPRRRPPPDELHEKCGQLNATCGAGDAPCCTDLGFLCVFYKCQPSCLPMGSTCGDTTSICCGDNKNESSTAQCLNGKCVAAPAEPGYPCTGRTCVHGAECVKDPFDGIQKCQWIENTPDTRCFEGDGSETCQKFSDTCKGWFCSNGYICPVSGCPPPQSRK